MSDTQRDQDRAAWAASPEFEREVTSDRVTVRTGDEARAAGRELLERVGGRPALDPTQPKGQRAPRRQVRLPDPLSAKVDAIAEQQHRSASAVMREAIELYVSTHDKTSA